MHYHNDIVQIEQQNGVKNREKMTNLSTYLSGNTTKSFSSISNCRKLMLIVGTSAAANAVICCASAAANATNLLHFSCSELHSELAALWLQQSSELCNKFAAL